MTREEYLKKILKDRNMSVQLLSNETSIPYSTVSDMLKNIGSARVDNIIKVCKCLDITVNQLQSVQDDLTDYNAKLSKSEKEHIKKYRSLDNHGKEITDIVLQKEYDRCNNLRLNGKQDVIDVKYTDSPVSAGLGEMLEDYNSWETIKVPLTPESRKADFVLRVSGDSMEPTFFDGDFILVRQQPAVDIGQIGIFSHNGDGYVKKYGGNKLISLNNKYSDIVLDEESRCFGLVLGTTEIIYD